MIDKTQFITTDLPVRREERYILFSDGIIDFLEKKLERKKFSDNETVQTIYLSNDEHSLPFLFTLKARRYLPTGGKMDDLFLTKWFLDIKERRDDKKIKARAETTLNEAIDFVNKEYRFGDYPLRPFFIIEYNRANYIYQDESGSYARFSLDTNLKYFYFESNNSAPQLIGAESRLRLEIKSRDQSADLENFIGFILKKFKALPVISKKGAAYNLLCQYLYKRDNISFSKEIKEVEIESKLESRSDKVFSVIYNAFRSGGLFWKIPKHFPHVFESSSVNRYYKGRGGVYKLMLRPDVMSIIRKGREEICSNSENLSCILKRSEVKDRFKSIQPGLFSRDDLEGELYRYRKSFWVENPETRRLYHISFDICQIYSQPYKSLFEAEVEYTGRYIAGTQGTVDEQAIIDEIAQITRVLLSLSKDLKESTLTKLNWLIGQ